MTLLETLFCQRLKHRLETRETQLRLTEKQLETQKKLTEMNRKNSEALRRHRDMYIARLEHVQQALDEAITIPTLEIHVEDEWLFDPYDAPWPIGDVVAADTEYYALPYETWMTVLPIIQVETVKARGKWIKEISDCVIPSELGWGLGLFLADGSCGLNKDGGYGGAFWRIVNGNRAYLERAKKAFEDYFPTVKFRINEYPSYKRGRKTNFGERKQTLYCLDVYAGNKDRNKKGEYVHGGRGKFIEKFRNSFYFFGMKKIPSCLWDKGNRKPKLEFMNGFIAGDGRHHNKGHQEVYVKSSSAVTGLIECMINIGWKFKITRDKGCFKISINRQREHIPFLMDFIYEHGEILYNEAKNWLNENYPGRSFSHAIKILEEEGYVKRLIKRTCTGKPQRLKALNPYPEACDNWATTMYDFMSIMFLQAGLRRQGGFMVVWSRTHAFNAFMDVEGKSYIYEPQNGKVVGCLDAGEGSYKPRKIWFPGTTPYSLKEA